MAQLAVTARLALFQGVLDLANKPKVAPGAQSQPIGQLDLERQLSSDNPIQPVSKL